MSINQKEKLTTGNLYNELDRLSDIKNNKEIKKNRIKASTKKITFKFYEMFKFILILCFIASFFIIKHIYSQEISSYFSQAESTITAPINDHYKSNYESNNKELENIPEITPTGIINKNGKKYIVLKYKNKIYTKTNGEKFADDTLEINTIKTNEVEIKDFKGNIFNFSIDTK